MFTVTSSVQLASGCTAPLLSLLLGVALAVGGVALIKQVREGGATDAEVIIGGCCFGLLLTWVGLIVTGGVIANAVEKGLCSP
ncbi:hypothetical protein AB0D12_31560 [Streptomyces sp. NPDC048479]|uniref:hypothetical protein n=1 Tax=Streptomyces sp. NPDC048479 TaxID=3154725 RepID=UPI00342E6D45